jgi:hypothetical protein
MRVNCGGLRKKKGGDTYGKRYLQTWQGLLDTLRGP